MKKNAIYLLFTMCFALVANAQTSIAPEADGFVRSNSTAAAYADRAELSAFRQVLEDESVKENRAIVLSFDLSEMTVSEAQSLDVKLKLYNVSAVEETEVDAAYELYVKQHDLADDAELSWDALELSSGDEYTFGDRVLEFTLANDDIDTINTFSSDLFNAKIKAAKLAGKKVALIITPQVQDLTVALPTRKFAGLASEDHAKPALVYSVDGNTSLNESKASKEVFFYPNPATSVINFSDKVLSASFTPLDGKVVKVVQANTNVDISGLESGIYLVKMELENGEKQVQRLIK